MSKRIAGLTVLLVATGCAGGGTLNPTTSVATSAPTATPNPGSSSIPTGTAKSITLAQNGAQPMQGIAGTFTLTAAEYDVNGKLIVGAYPQPIAVTTNDSTDLTLSALPANGNAGGSATIPNSQTVVLVSYDGLSVPNGTQFAASADGLKSVTTKFAPLASSGPVQVASLAIAETGAAPYYGTPGQFALSINAFDAHGNPISGSYATPVVVTTNDNIDLSLSTTQGGPGSGSVTVPNAQTTVFVSYDGNVVPNGTVFAAVSGSASYDLTFDPGSSSAPPPIITTIGVTRNGANPILGTLGVFPVFVTAYDQGGHPINGTLPSAINVTLNDTCDLSLSLGGAGSVSPCIIKGVPQSVDNNGASIINNADQVVFINYDGKNPLPASTAISATALGNVCTVISFPGNLPVTCPAPVPGGSRFRKILR